MADPSPDARLRALFLTAVRPPLSQDAAAAIFDDLVRRHTTHERAYHNLAHLLHMAEVLEAALRDRTGRPLSDFPAAVLAVCFHDAVYDPRRQDNETESARLAGEKLAGLDPDLLAAVAGLIDATRHFASRDAENGEDAKPSAPDVGPPPKSSNELELKKIFVDADLAILGSDERPYEAYEKAIRAEYAWVEENRYREGRSAVLKSFLDRPRIYSTEWFFSRFETQARKNLARALSALKTP